MSSRRKKKLTRSHDLPKLDPPGERYPAKVRAFPDESQHEYICEGCDHVQANDKTCGIYAFVPPYYIRNKCCYFNRPAPKKKVDVRGRVGQQKTKRMGG
jgi:hypothetical protein